MLRVLMLLAALLVSTTAYAQVTNYSFASSSYVSATSFAAPCSIGPCATYASSMQVTGFLTTSRPASGGIPESDLLSYSFYDGLNSYSSGDPNIRMIYFVANANSAGNIVSMDMSLLLWQTGTNPHVPGDRYAFLTMSMGRQVSAVNNRPCPQPGFYASPTNFGYDACNAFATDSFESQATNGASGTGIWTRLSGPLVPASVTLSAGSNQSTLVGTPFAQALVALVQDASGNPLPGVTVTWATPDSGPNATLSQSSAVTNVNGLATIAASANSISGSYAVTAHAGALIANFTLTNAITISAGSCGGGDATNSALVEQYYAAILRRPSDAEGKAFWISEANRLCALGTDPKATFFLLANVFFNSPEYLAFARSDSEFVTDLYITLFGRLPDASGLTYWTGQLAAGMPRNILMSSLLFSPEFTAAMNRLFQVGRARAETYLVLNLYGGLFRRLADSSGYTYWDSQFQAAECNASPAAAVTATISALSSQFVASPEYAARATSDSQYVQDLYYALLQRGGDLAGFNFWVNQIASGMQSRDQVRQQFLQSPEMQAQSAAMAAQGCLR